MGRAAVLILVTGGGGFLGKEVCLALRARGDAVRSISRGDYPELRAEGIETFSGDLGDLSSLRRAMRGCDAVVHSAAKAGLWGPRLDYWRTNVFGTSNVIEAAIAEKIPRLVYTSSPSVVFGGEGIEGGDESLPYPVSYLAHYPETKAEAERLVLGANSKEIATAALRPHLIWGPGDNHIAPRLIARRRAGHLRRVGGNPRVDSTYIDNAVLAHLAALDNLPRIGGKAYFISNGEPLPLWDLIDGILNAAGLPPVEGRIPASAAYGVGAVLEAAYWFFGIRSEPRMTRFLAKELSTPHWFNIDAARRDLGYEPKVSIKEGLKRLKKSF